MTKLVIINGPTAVGKSAVAVEFSKLAGAEIISADSMQVYKGMDIGTAKITREEMQGIPHHLIDIIEPDEDFSVLKFKELAKRKIDEITSRGNIPVICGGTGFYIQAVLYDVDFSGYDDELEAQIRERLEEELENKGSLYLFERLKSVDPEYAAVIHPNNTRRLLHSLEFYELTGKKMSEHNREQNEKTSPYDFHYFCLNSDRDKIYKRIGQRVDRMIEDGLEGEVRRLLDMGYGRDLQSMLGIGYKEMADYLYGDITFDEAVNNIKKETRHYAKKQLTWLKREKDVKMIDMDSFADSKAAASHIYREVMK